MNTCIVLQGKISSEDCVVSQAYRNCHCPEAIHAVQLCDSDKLPSRINLMAIRARSVKLCGQQGFRRYVGPALLAYNSRDQKIRENGVTAKTFEVAEAVGVTRISADPTTPYVSKPPDKPEPAPAPIPATVAPPPPDDPSKTRRFTHACPRCQRRVSIGGFRKVEQFEGGARAICSSCREDLGVKFIPRQKGKSAFDSAIQNTGSPRGILDSFDISEVPNEFLFKCVQELHRRRNVLAHSLKSFEDSLLSVQALAKTRG